jgi:hypothetical protein
MNRRSTSRLPALLFLACLPLVLAACGNKGPLVLPSAPASTAVPAAAEPPSDAAAEPPAEAATEPPSDAAAELPADAANEPAATDPAPEPAPPPANAR